MHKFYDSECNGWHMLLRGILINSQKNVISLQTERLILRCDFFYQKVIRNPKHDCVRHLTNNILKSKTKKVLGRRGICRSGFPYVHELTSDSSKEMLIEELLTYLWARLREQTKSSETFRLPRPGSYYGSLGIRYKRQKWCY